MQVSRKLIGIEGGIQRTTSRILPMENRMVMCSMALCLPVFLFETDYVITGHFQKRQKVA